MLRSGIRGAFVALAAFTAIPAAAQEPLPRTGPRAGAIVSAKGGEELQIPREIRWHPAVVGQDVVGGDTLRTGEIGTLGITFADQTTIRIGRQSTLVINKIAGGGADTELNLTSGSVWARAARGGTGVQVRTPAASASIRGTDWSLSVQGDRTSIIVLEGVVDFANAQGSVTLRQGEAATARIGERPTRTVLVRPDDREQMLFYLELRGIFTALPATGLDGAARRAERARLAAIPPASRTAADWVGIAENGLGADDPAMVRDAVAAARRQIGTSGPLAARLDLVDGMLAGAQRRYSDAGALLTRAAAGTAGRQRMTAQCGLIAATALTDPQRKLSLPRADDSTPGDPSEAICRAYLTGFAKGLEEAGDILRRAETAHPEDQLVALLSAQVALLLNRRDEMRATVARMRGNDPDGAETLLASGYVKGYLDGNPDGAVADFSRGVALAPGNAQLWGGLGLVQDERDARREAETAFKQAIALDPDDPVAYANYANLLLDQSRVDEAGKLIETSLRLDPSFDMAYTTKGRYLLQKGDPAAAMDFLLAGSAANPASAQGLLAIAIAQYQAGEVSLANQALDNADRLDPYDPVTSIARTAIAIDSYQADTAVTAAREAVRRYRNRGGFYAGLATTRTGGSYLGQAYRFLSLEEWGRYYTDRVADPFTATSYFDQAVAMRARPFFSRPSFDQLTGSDFADVAGNFAIQGLLLDPLAVSGRLGRIDLLRRPFVDVEVGGGLTRRGRSTGWETGVSLQAFSNTPVPTSVSLTASQQRPATGLRQADGQSAALFVGMAPSATDRVLLWGTASGSRPVLETPTVNTYDSDASRVRAYQLGAGWSHTLGYRNVLSLAAVATRADQSQTRLQGNTEIDPIFGPVTLEFNSRRDVKVDALTAAAGHNIAFGDLILRTGVEAQSGTIRGFVRDRATFDIPAFPPPIVSETEDPVASHFQAGRAYADLLWQPSDRLQVQGGAHLLGVDRAYEASRGYLDPRLGIAVSPSEGHWLRAAWRRDSEIPASFTLSPLPTVGLLPNALPVQLGGRRDTTALRWDAEWTPRFFTSVEYQGQRARKLQVPVPDTLELFDLPRARIDYLTATANVWLTHGVGAFATVGLAESETRDALGRDTDIPYVPRRFARGGVTFVHPSRVRVSLIENIVGSRLDAPGGRKLDTVYTTDLTMSYETPDRRLILGLSLLNIFDADYELTAARPTLIEPITGTGRALLATARIRF